MIKSELQYMYIINTIFGILGFVDYSVSYCSLCRMIFCIFLFSWCSITALTKCQFWYSNTSYPRINTEFKNSHVYMLQTFLGCGNCLLRQKLGEETSQDQNV